MRYKTSKMFLATSLITMITLTPACGSKKQSQGSRQTGASSSELIASGKDQAIAFSEYLTNGTLVVTIVTDQNFTRTKNRIAATLDPTYSSQTHSNIGVHPIPWLTKESFFNFVQSPDMMAKYENASIAMNQLVEWLAGSGGQAGFLKDAKVTKQEDLSQRIHDGGRPINWYAGDGMVSDASKLPAEPSRDQSIDLMQPQYKYSVQGTLVLGAKNIPVDVLVIVKNPTYIDAISDVSSLVNDGFAFASPEAAAERFKSSGVVIFNGMGMVSTLSGRHLSDVLGESYKRDQFAPKRTLFVQNRCFTENDEANNTAKLQDGFDIVSTKTITDSRSFGLSNSRLLATLATSPKLSNIVDALSVPELSIQAVLTKSKQGSSDNAATLRLVGEPAEIEEIFDSGAATPVVPQPTPIPELIDDGHTPPAYPPIIPDDGIPDGDPLVLNLDGTDLIRAKSSDAGMTMFDINGNAVKTKTQWIRKGSGFLVLDHNNDGVITSATEMFRAGVVLKNGLLSSSGFDQLGQYDNDKNGVIDAKDEIFASLKVWHDLNEDGVTQSGELFAFSNIATSIDLNARDIRSEFKTLAGSQHSPVSHEGHFVKKDGSKGLMQNIFFSAGLDLSQR